MSPEFSKTLLYCLYLCQYYTYRANVLVAGVNKLTKRIPADKYQKFIKKKLMSSTIYLNDLQFKITDANTEEQMLHERYVTSKHIRDTVFETDMHNVRMMNKKLLKEQIEMQAKNKELKQHLSMHIIFWPKIRGQNCSLYLVHNNIN